MSPTLSPEIENLISGYIRSGKYESAEQVIAAAMMSLGQQLRLAERGAFPDIDQKLAEGCKPRPTAGPSMAMIFSNSSIGTLSNRATSANRSSVRSQLKPAIGRPPLDLTHWANGSR